MNTLADVLIFSGLACAVAFCLWTGNGEGGR